MPEDEAHHSPETPDAGENVRAKNLRVEVEAEKLMNGGREAIIIHNGERYRLRVTSKHKLILTK